MAYELNTVLLNKLRSELHTANTKLWLEPYTDTTGKQTNKLLELAADLSSRLQKPVNVVSFHLEHLRTFSLQKLSQNEAFKKEGIATIRLKYSPKPSNDGYPQFVQLKLDSLGSDFISKVCEILQVTTDQVKVIHSGKVIAPDRSLTSQGLRHNRTVLCMVLSETGQDEANEAEKQMQELRAAKRGAELLASTSGQAVDRFDPQITDQDGRTIDMPQDEKSSLTMALSLHEMGRKVLKKKQYGNALLFLLEADVEFRQCRAEILNSVDNFAVLCLDIAWCYMCLNNLDTLQDADDRLKQSEEYFRKSYGESLQRLLSIKGTSGHEVVLFVRLYLLQGVVQYFSSNYRGAFDLLNKALSYADTMKVDEDKFTEMINLGFTSTESRMALRACGANVAAATQYAFKQREEKEEILKAEKEKSRKRQLARKLGKCANGSDINVDLYEQMATQLGFDTDLASEALKQCNNDLGQAIELIHGNSDVLRAGIKTKVSKTNVKKVEEMGFDPTSAKGALHHFKGDIEKSVEFLSTHQGIVPPAWLADMQVDDSASSSSKSKELTTDDKSALEKIAEVVDNEENYLDVLVDEEMEYIMQYLALAKSALE